MSDEKKIPIKELMEANAHAEDTLRHHEARRSARRLGDMEQRFDLLIATVDVQQDALKKLIHERAIDQEQIEKLIVSSHQMQGEMSSMKAELQDMHRNISMINNSLGELIDPQENR